MIFFSSSKEHTIMGDDDNKDFDRAVQEALDVRKRAIVDITLKKHTILSLGAFNNDMARGIALQRRALHEKKKIRHMDHRVLVAKLKADKVHKKIILKQMLDERLITEHSTGFIPCLKCKKVKAVDEFYMADSGAGRKIWCKDCVNIERNLNSRPIYMNTLLGRTKARAKASDIPFFLKYEDLEDLFDKQEGRCALSGRPMTYLYRTCPDQPKTLLRNPTNASVDRIDSDGDYSVANIQLTQCVCNMSKQDQGNRAFIEMCDAISSWNKAEKC